MTRRQEFFLYCIILVGTALRLYQIGVQSLWFDELVSVTISRLNLYDALVISGSIDPPLYYFLLHFWLDLGDGEVFIRVLSAIFSIATIPAVFILGKRLIDVRVGLTAALIFAVAPIQLFYAQEARMYSLLVFFSTLSIWIYDRAQESRRMRDWAVWVVFASLAIYSHIFAGVLLGALDLDALWRWHKQKAPLREILVANVGIGLLMIPWMMVLLPKFGYLIGILWLQPPTILHPLKTLVYFVFGYTAALPFSVIALFILLMALAFLVTSASRAMRQSGHNHQAGLRLLLLASFFPMIFTLVISQWRAMYLDRWLLESATPFYLLLAWGFVVSDRRRILRVCSFASIPLLAVAIFNYFAVSDFQKPALREAVAKIADRRTPSEIVLHTSAGSILAGRFYDPQGKHVLLYHPADLFLAPWLLDSLQVPYVTDPARLLSDNTSVWLVVVLDHIVEEQLAEKAWFDRSAVVDEQYLIGGIGLYRYTVSQKRTMIETVPQQ